MSDGDGQVEGLDQEVGLARLRRLVRVLGPAAVAQGLVVDEERVEAMLERREGLDAGVLHNLDSITGMFTGAVEEEDAGDSLALGPGGRTSDVPGADVPGVGAVADAVNGGEWPGRVWETDPPSDHWETSGRGELDVAAAEAGVPDLEGYGDGMSVVMTEPDPEAGAGLEFPGGLDEEPGLDALDRPGEDRAAVCGKADGDGAVAGGMIQPVVGVDLDGDGRADLPLVGVGLVKPGVSWTEEIEQKRVALRSARALALMSQFPLGISYQRHVASVGLVTQIELALISFYHEAVPDPNVVWDAERRGREIGRRLGRLRWVEREQHREYGGFKGVWNRLVGNRKVSGAELYERMVQEADGLLKAIEGGNLGEDVMREVMRLTGVDDLGELNPG